jgi:putative acetyltransferase
MVIRTDTLDSPVVRALLEEHLRNMHEISPPGSVHALDIDALQQPGITFWTAWRDDELLGCGALKQLDPAHGEIKSMRTATRHRRSGVARAIVAHIIAVAQERGYARLSLETGSMPEFDPARRLYQDMGFAFCGPFNGYTDDPNSTYMTRML